MQKEPLLFLCHRIPFPPNKGDKIRSFNMLKRLAEDYDVYLASYVDDPFDWQYESKLDKYCKQKLLLNQNKLHCKIKGLKAFVTGDAISLPYYYDARIKDWVKQICARHSIKNIFVYSSVMAQFLTPQQLQQATLVVDYVDVDSDKWRQYADGMSGIAKWVYSREHKRLQAFEIAVAERASQALFVSPQEADLFKSIAPAHLAPRISGMLNGVDTAFFDPQNTSIETLPEQVDVVFTGAMDYWANVDAVCWFAEKVWPAVIAERPDATFYIVGGNPSPEVQALGQKPGIHVTGRVKDVRPYVLYAKVAVAPLQIARGIQNKVLEAMALAKPIVATSMAMEGIEAETAHIDVCDQPDDFSQRVIQAVTQPESAQDNRQWVQENLKWQATLAPLNGLFKRSKNDSKQ